MNNNLYKSNENFVINNIANETVIVPISSSVANMGNLLILNDTGAFIINHIKESTTIFDIANAMSKEFEVPDEQTLLNDIECFMLEMVKRGFFTEIQK